MTKAKLMTVLVAAAVLAIVLVLVVRGLSELAITALVSALAGFVIGVLASFFILRRGKPGEPHHQP